MAHDFRKSSGTTDTCIICGCTRYHQDERGAPTRRGPDARYARWVDEKWVGYTTKDTKEPPQCVPSRGEGDSFVSAHRAG